MNHLKGLKEDLKVLEESFPKSHPRFRVTSASVDELSCQFLEPTEGGRKHVFLAYFIESYPASSPPIWSSESDNSVVNQALSSLETFQVNNVIHQVKHLLVQLCESYNVPMPEECTDVKSEFSKYISTNLLTPPLSPSKNKNSSAIEHAQTKKTKVDEFKSEEAAEEDDEDEDGPEDNDEFEDEDDDLYDNNFEDDVDEANKEKTKDEEVDTEQVELLEKLKAKHKDSNVGSLQANDRLMKELRQIYKSAAYKSGEFAIELVDESLYEWNVKIIKLDSESPLAQDLKELAKKNGQDHILLSMTFKDSFPFSPPFVRVVSPVILGGYIMNGGAICTELLTNDGWSSAYSVEAVITQLTSFLVQGNERKGKPRIQFQIDPKYVYTKDHAEKSFEFALAMHKKTGWGKSAKKDG